MFENPRRGREARNFTTNVPKILVLKSSSEQIFSRILPLGAPDITFRDCRVHIFSDNLSRNSCIIDSTACLKTGFYGNALENCDIKREHFMIVMLME